MWTDRGKFHYPRRIMDSRGMCNVYAHICTQLMTKTRCNQDDMCRNLSCMYVKLTRLPTIYLPGPYQINIINEFVRWVPVVLCKLTRLCVDKCVKYTRGITLYLLPLLGNADRYINGCWCQTYHLQSSPWVFHFMCNFFLCTCR